MLKVIYCLNVLVAVGGFQGVSEAAMKNHEKVVGIQIDGAPKCLGAFVVSQPEENESKTLESVLDTTTEFIATAAHCVYGVQASRLKVVFWRTSTENKEVKEVKGVKRVMVHPYYMPPSPDYDIALLKMNRNDGGPGLLLKKDVSTQDDLKAFEWKNSKLEPKSANLEDRKSCRAKLANHIVVSTRMLCANINSVMDGSPLIKSDRYIVGLGSYYGREGSEINPKIFTNIANSEIYSFIERYID